MYISGISTVDYSVNSVLREREREVYNLNPQGTYPPGNSVNKTWSQDGGV